MARENLCVKAHAGRRRRRRGPVEGASGARAREPPLRLGSLFVRWAGASPRHGGGGGGALTGWGGADKALGMETARPEVGAEARARAARRSSPSASAVTRAPGGRRVEAAATSLKKKKCL